MKFKIIAGVLFIIILTSIAVNAFHSNGIAGYTNSPGESNCTNCHLTHPVNTTGGSALIDIPNSLNNQYIPGRQYQVNFTVRRTGMLLFGFDLEALDSNGANAGIITLIDSNSTILIPAIINGNSRTNITHYGGTLVNDSCTFSFYWTAPISNIGNVTFYASGIASNNDGTTFGEFVYTDNKILSPDLNTIINTTKDPDTEIVLYPNPVHESATLSYYISYPTFVSVNLLDINGSYLKTFYSAYETPGQYNMSITNNQFYKKGLYLLNVIIQNHSYYKKICVE